MTSSRSGKSKGDKGFLRDNGLTVFFGTIFLLALLGGTATGCTTTSRSPTAWNRCRCCGT